MNAATNPLNSTAIAERQQTPKDFPAMLTAWLPEIQRALPKHLSAERISRIALTAFRRTPKLGECDPRSVFAAVIQSSQLGLEIDMLGRAYLVPYTKNTKTADGWKKTTECQFIPGWKGLVDLMNRSGQGTVWTGAVFEGDEFDWQLGDNPFVRHKPRGEMDPDRMTHVYAIGRVKGSDWPVIEVWPVEKVKKHLAHYNKVGDKHYAFENWEMYARKVPLLQVLKYMPCSAELATAIAMNDSGEIGSQGLQIKDAIEGTWAPPVEETHDDDGGAHEGASKPSGATVLKNAAAKAKDRAEKVVGEGTANAAPFKVDIETIISDIQNAKSAEIAALALDLAKTHPDADYERAAAAYRATWVKDK